MSADGTEAGPTLAIIIQKKKVYTMCALCLIWVLIIFQGQLYHPRLQQVGKLYSLRSCLIFSE